MATPILASSRDVLGLLLASTNRGRAQAKSFSSFDLHVLGFFARAIGPTMERFLRIRESTVLVKVTRDIASAIAGTEDLATLLKHALEAVVRGLNAQMGSIYLIEEDQNQIPLVVLKAAIGRNADLLETAKYRLGEGITGTIAEGQSFNFKTIEELRAHPRWVGKYVKALHAVGSQTFLGVPIRFRERVLGVWKLENVSSGPLHPDPYFTDEDMQLLNVLSAFIAYLIIQTQFKVTKTDQFKHLAHSSIDIEKSQSEEDAILAILGALERAGFRKPTLWLMDPGTAHFYVMIDTAGSRQVGDIDDESLADLLKAGEAQVTVKKDRAIWMIPLRVTDESIGALRLETVNRKQLDEDEVLLLKAFAGHLAISVSRLRNASQVADLTEQIMANSRFVVAQTLSSLAVHSIQHLMGSITKQLEKDLGKPSIRNNGDMSAILTEWQTKLRSGMSDINNALLFVKSDGNMGSRGPVEAHDTIRATVSMWYNYLTQNKCKISHELTAEHSYCLISRPALKEIISVLLVNSVQAHAKRICLRSYNGHRIESPAGNFIATAWFIDIMDDGDGLVTSKPEEIFEPTYTTKADGIGSGLGLFIARQLARASGGDLVVADHQQAKGASFRLTLPA
jgi:signal transduction histidine kinase